MGKRGTGEGKRALALSLLLIATGPFVMYYSIASSSTIFIWAGLAETAIGMLLALLKA